MASESSMAGSTAVGPSCGGFPTTRWSQIHRSADEDASDSLAELDAVLRVYLPLLARDLQHRFQISSDDTEDLLQAFVEQRVLGKRLLAVADPGRGRFRTFLLTALHHFVQDQWRAQSAARRKPVAGWVPLDEISETDAGVSPTGRETYDHEWAMTVIRQAGDRTREFYQERQRLAVWRVFDDGFLRPQLGLAERPSSRELAEKHGFASDTKVDDAIALAKRMYGRFVESVVREYVQFEQQSAHAPAPLEDRVQEELRELMEALGHPPA